MKNYTLLSIFFFYLFHTNVYSQIEFQNHIVTDESFETLAKEIFSVDLDNDGDIDIITISSEKYDSDGFIDGNIKYFENLNNSSNFKLHFIDSPNDIFDIEIVDIDRDGDKDIIAFIEYRYHLGGNGYTKEQKIVWYENNDGLGNFNDKKILFSNEYSSTGKIISSDLDGDNDLDIIFTFQSYTGTKNILWLENNNGNFNNTHHIDSSDSYILFTDKTFDLDGDNDQDLLTYDNEGFFKWYKNDGQGNFNSVIINTNLSISQFKLGDIDNDSKIDIIVDSNGDGQEEDKIVWYKNTNNFESFSTPQTISSSSEGYFNHLNIVDIDDDNDLDIIFGIRGHEKTVWKENMDGLGTFDTEHLISDVDNQLKLIISDINGDQNLDVITCEQDGLIWSIFVYEKNISENNYNSAINIADFPQDVRNTFVLDVDGDNDLDLIANSSYSTEKEIVLFKNLDGNCNFGNQIVIQGNLSGSIEAVGDIDNDGDIDFIFREYFTNNNHDNDGTYFYENIDGLGNFVKKTISNTVDNNIILKDLDNDNDLDILVSRKASYSNSSVTWVWYKNDGLGNLIEQNEIYSSEKFDGFTSYIESLADDIDGDGKLDLILAYGNGGNKKLSWLKNVENFNNFEEERIIYTFSDSGLIRNISSGDIDNDGDIDLIFRKGLNPYLIKNSNGLDLFEEPQIISSNQEHVFYLSDIDNDNDLDLVSGYQSVSSGSLGWYENIDGLGTYGSKQIISDDISHPDDIKIVDLDKDGDKDIVSNSYYQSRITWYENLGPTADVESPTNTLSVNEIETNTFSIYPNPSNNLINIKSKNILNNIFFYDINGREVKNIKLNNVPEEYQISISNLPKGFYFIKIHSNEQQKVIKFVKN